MDASTFGADQSEAAGVVSFSDTLCSMTRLTWSDITKQLGESVPFIEIMGPLITGTYRDGTPFTIPVDTSTMPAPQVNVPAPQVTVNVPAAVPTFFTEAVSSTLAASSVATGAQRDGLTEFRAVSAASAAHTLRVEGSSDGTTWFPIAEQISSIKVATSTASLTVYPATRYVRAHVSNQNVTAISGVWLRTATL